MNQILNTELPVLLYDNELWWRLLITCTATVIVNLPFGYLRGSLRRFSFLWFLSIHVPVPLVILVRKFHHLNLTWELAPFLLGSFFLGQFLGRKAYVVRTYRNK